MESNDYLYLMTGMKLTLDELKELGFDGLFDDKLEQYKSWKVNEGLAFVYGESDCYVGVVNACFSCDDDVAEEIPVDKVSALDVYWKLRSAGFLNKDSHLKDVKTWLLIIRG